MRILVVCQRYYPDNFQITPICQQMAADGHDVTVMTGLPNYHTGGVVPEGYRTGHRREVISGVQVIRCYEIGRRRGPFFWGVNAVSFFLSACMKALTLREEFDVVFLYQLSPILMSVPGCLYARKHGLPILLYCCDLWPESMKVYIKNERNILFRIMRAVSKKVYDASCLIAVQSPGYCSYLREYHGIPDEKMIYVPAFADESYLEEDLQTSDNVTDFMFLGNMGIAQDLFSVLDAVEKIRDLPGFHVHFVGDGVCLKELRQYAKERGLGSLVTFYGWRPVDEMPAFYRLADVCLLPLGAGLLSGYAIPSKLQGYMAAGKTVLGMSDGPTRDIIENSGCGVCVGAGDVDGLAGAMREFVEHRERCARHGGCARMYYKEEFQKRRFMEKLYDAFAKVMEVSFVDV